MMDATTYTDIWVNLATNSPFLGWMIYTYLQTQKDLKQTREDSKTEMREIRTEARDEEARIRDRFEAVIKDLHQDRKILIDGFSTRIDSLERGQKKLFAILEPIREQIQEIKLKEELKKQLDAERA
ncbi:MAG: hypothetical protein CL605_00175 [Altibacter sp.]|uniref:hypothetical protein n=1 Tax=Altibacter sp. TaxID=2024823 RepID=UPI000C8D0075|nr:hypothetical protein [Altibacter sp.]MAP53296.1 hypothetical protein [Altibacter sp.]|tara:strand:- start:1594 stop:1971 length:378 start_codon:yes stop_codon:yes gene_type:complete